MTPKEKAKQIYDNYSTFVVMWKGNAVTLRQNVTQCALITVNEVIDQWDYIDTYLADGNGELNPNLKYWYEVRKEIIKLSNKPDWDSLKEAGLDTKLDKWD